MWRRSRFATGYEAAWLAPGPAHEHGCGEPELSELDPSPLGTQAHWNAVYARELAVHSETGDEGERWFGEQVTDAMAEWATTLLEDIRVADPALASLEGQMRGTRLAPPDALAHALPTLPHEHEAVLDAVHHRARVVELGCGNGTLLLSMARAGADPRVLAGCDYSDAAVQLARDVAAAAGYPDILYFRQDISDMALPAMDLVLDKGTFDAIALHADRTLFYAYASIVARHLAGPSARLVITSCNFTQIELDALFSPVLVRRAVLEHAEQFTFGGVTGNTVTTAAYGLPLEM